MFNTVHIQAKTNHQSLKEKESYTNTLVNNTNNLAAAHDNEHLSDKGHLGPKADFPSSLYVKTCQTSVVVGITIKRLMNW